MPTTRSQVQEKSEKKTRASRKRIQLVVNYCDPLSFDFAASNKTEMDMACSSEAKMPKMSVSEEDKSSARTRIYNRPNKERKVLEPETHFSSQDEVQVIEENVRNPVRVVRVSSIGKKSTWITHVATPAKATSPECGTQTEKSSQEIQESDGDDSGIKIADKQSTKPKTKTILDLSKVPRYLLNPDAFENNRVMQERITKSIYDRERRDKDMKAKVGKLSKENLYLRQMLLWMTMNKGKQPDGVYIASPVVSLPPAKTIAPTESIFKASVPIQLGSVYPRKSSQIQNNSEEKLVLPSGTVMSFPVLHAAQKRHRSRNDSTKPRQPRKKPTKAQKLANEKEYLTSLYEQFDNDSKEDMDAILAAISGPDVSSSSPTTTDATPGKNKRKQDMTLRNARETEVVDKKAEEEDEIQILEEIPNTFTTLISKRYSDVIFEEA